MASSTHQSPMFHVPMKKTDDVEWIGPLRRHIANVYQDSPDHYNEELTAINRVRQDMRGAGKDMIGRDLLYRYYGQLELLDLRFPIDENHVKVSFNWYDAFSQKPTAQFSIAYEKACTIFNMAACLSAIAALTPRIDAEGRKKSYHNFRAAAGMFSYINENFLHAPSLDLGRDTIKVLIDIQTVQAQEVFLESSIDGKKSAAVVAKIAGQAAFQYSNLIEEIKDLVGKKILDRNWQYVVEVKSKYFHAFAQLWRAQADEAAAKYGDALGRLALAEITAKDAVRLTWNTTGISSSTAERVSLAPDTAVALNEMTKALVTLIGERKAKLTRDNDLIYHARPTTETSLPALEKLFMGAALPINEVYGTPAVQQIIGADIFAKLIPLSVHESASRYSEEKAQMVRAEAEKADMADSELAAALEYLDLPGGLEKYRSAGIQGQQSVMSAPPREIQIAADEVKDCEDSRDSAIEPALAQIASLRSKIRQRLSSLPGMLDEETMECEGARSKYGHLFTQGPSGSLTGQWRTDIRDHLDTMNQATRSDDHTLHLWEDHKDMISILRDGADGPALIKVFKDLCPDETSARATKQSLLDLDDPSSSASEGDKLSMQIRSIEEELGRLNKIKRERREVLKDLKEKIKGDDISHLLILNKKSAGIEPALFASELEKFRPHQTRLGQTIMHQQSVIQELTGLLKNLAGDAQGKAIATQWQTMERQRRQLISSLKKAKEAYDEVREGTSQGLSFYRSLEDAANILYDSVDKFVKGRASERRRLVEDISMRGSAETAAVSSYDMSSVRQSLPPQSQGPYSNQHRSPTMPVTTPLSYARQYPVEPSNLVADTYRQSGLPPPPPPLQNWQHQNQSQYQQPNAYSAQASAPYSSLQSSARQAASQDFGFDRPIHPSPSDHRGSQPAMETSSRSREQYNNGFPQNFASPQGYAPNGAPQLPKKPPMPQQGYY